MVAVDHRTVVVDLRTVVVDLHMVVVAHRMAAMVAVAHRMVAVVVVVLQVNRAAIQATIQVLAAEEDEAQLTRVPTQAVVQVGQVGQVDQVDQVEVAAETVKA